MTDNENRDPGQLVAQMLDDLELLQMHFDEFQIKASDPCDVIYFDLARLKAEKIAASMHSYRIGFAKGRISRKQND